MSGASTLQDTIINVLREVSMTNYETSHAVSADDYWLRRYYFVRAGFSFIWVAAALTGGRQSFALAAVLSIIYPAWDAAANFFDAARNGGLSNNRSQSVNVAVSVLMTIAVSVAVTQSMNWVLGLFGVWAILSGLLQLVTAVRRWNISGGQWTMILSGGQSSLAGAFFIFQAQMPAEPSIANIAGYAGFGAFYFLVSAVWLSVIKMRSGKS